MRKLRAIVSSAVFFVMAPCVFGAVIPWWITGWEMQPASDPVRYLGAVLIVLPLPVLVDSFRRFAVEGLGTPAPVAPTQHLIVTGYYRYVRNPMYLAVSCALVGQALLFTSPWLAVYSVCFAAACHMFVIIYEEPTLSLRFGAAYKAYRKAVPRWIPRRTPWKGD